MKLTKKAAALLLAASLAVSVCATPVFAAENMGSQTGVNTGTETKVLYEVTEKFTWTVPATIDFGKDAGPKEKIRTVEAKLGKDETGKAADATNGTAPKVVVTENIINSGKNLRISLKAANSATDFKVVNGSDSLGYTVKTTAEKKDETETTGYTPKTVDAASGTEILTLAAGKNTGEVELEFKLTTTTATAEVAGKYEGKVVFTADATT